MKEVVLKLKKSPFVSRKAGYDQSTNRLSDNRNDAFGAV
jgi:hypothetical protein